jgi:dynein heavy chain
LKNGLDKLEDANKSVDEMKILLGKMEPELKKASEETDKMLERLKIDKADADMTLKIVSVEEAEASIQEQEARKLGAEAEAAVSEANN